MNTELMDKMLRRIYRSEYNTSDCLLFVKSHISDKNVSATIYKFNNYTHYVVVIHVVEKNCDDSGRMEIKFVSTAEEAFNLAIEQLPGKIQGEEVNIQCDKDDEIGLLAEKYFIWSTKKSRDYDVSDLSETMALKRKELK